MYALNHYRIILCVLVLSSWSFQSSCLAVFNTAHRGEFLLAPENTIAAITLAAPTANAVEFDVRFTLDDKFVLMHDSTLERTTNGTGTVVSQTLAEIQALDAGSWFSPEFAGEQIPTLEQAIQATNALGLYPIIDRKSGGSEIYHAEMQRLGLAPESFHVITFDPSFLSNLNSLNPAYNLGLYMFGTDLDQTIINLALSNGIDSLFWSHLRITQQSIELAHSNGLQLHATGLDEESRMAELLSFGIDGILTDESSTLHQIITNASADFNYDSIVDGEDLTLWKENYSSVSPSPGDADIDGDVDGADFLIWQREFSSPASATVVVPEPTTCTLALAALCLLVGKRQLRQSPGVG